MLKKGNAAAGRPGLDPTERSAGTRRIARRAVMLNSAGGDVR